MHTECDVRILIPDGITIFLAVSLSDILEKVDETYLSEEHVSGETTLRCVGVYCQSLLTMVC
jgi:hypothetical protein